MESLEYAVDIPEDFWQNITDNNQPPSAPLSAASSQSPVNGTETESPQVVEVRRIRRLIHRHVREARRDADDRRNDPDWLPGGKRRRGRRRRQ